MHEVTDYAHVRQRFPNRCHVSDSFQVMLGYLAMPPKIVSRITNPRFPVCVPSRVL
jgi:hypothetical protein